MARTLYVPGRIIQFNATRNTNRHVCVKSHQPIRLDALTKTPSRINHATSRIDRIDTTNIRHDASGRINDHVRTSDGLSMRVIILTKPSTNRFNLIGFFILCLQIMAPISMGDLCALPTPTEDKEFCNRIIKIINDNYPQDWKSWEVENYTYTELFGETISSKTEAKIRFAIPTAQLGEAYTPNDPSLSEKKFRIIKRILLRWCVGRALIYSPHSLVEKIHAHSYEHFMSTVKILKPKLTAQRASTPSSTQRKRQSESPTASCSTTKSARHESSDNQSLQISFFEKMMQVLVQQTAAIDSVATQVAALTSKESEADQSQIPDSEASSDSEGEDQRDFELPPFLDLPPSPRRVDTTPKETNLEAQIREAESNLLKLRNQQVQDVNCDFSPCTTEAEPKLGKANPQLVDQGRKCQRLGDDGWKNIRYAEVQKTFHVAPVFGSLKVNSLLATSTPRTALQGHLEKTDLTLGAISYGLFLQRKAFEDAWKKLDSNAQQEVQKKFLAPECEFRKISDGLVQYTCGRRAEVLQTRRETYKPTNKVLHDILHDIPPSDTHLFCEDKLGEAVKNQGGVHKFLPKRNFYSNNKSVRKTTATAPKRPSKNIREGRIQSNKRQPFRNARATEKPGRNDKPARNFPNAGRKY